MPVDFSANASALGYFYQARYALLLLLEASPDAELSLEKFDDISFEKAGKPSELLQLKHHITNTGSLSNASTDLWKTLRVWSTRVLSGDTDVSSTTFSLITTAAAPNGSAASLLRPHDRNVSEADEVLCRVASESESSTNKAGYDAFLALSSEDRLAMLDNVVVLDASPKISDVQSVITRKLQFSTRPQYVESVYERIEGWWFRRVISHLNESTSSPITHRELLEILNDIQEEYFQDNLPIEFLDLIAPDESELSAEQRIFVLQLRLVSVAQPRVRKAINDYYRAFEQRSKWMREDLLGIVELDKYENRLADEWERIFEIMKEDLSTDPTESDYENAGRRLFNRIDTEFNVPIRPRCTEPYVMRGSYHMLSNDRRVGWHAMFLDRLNEVFARPQVGIE